MGFSLLFQKQNKEVARKLGIATGCMFILPLAVFFICSVHVFPHKQNPDSWAAGFAILTANIVIAGYVISAFSEKDEEELTRGDERGPRVGAFKTRTD
mmetsp:Transcript_47809/g.70769  ORF Transcript_47809/g.70769 Transcript_47809/m.70769 type:complete len:98 (-) Transcript_47809:582-875(-)